MRLTQEDLQLVWESVQRNYKDIETVMSPKHGYPVNDYAYVFPDFDNSVNEMIEGLLILQQFIETKNHSELYFYGGHNEPWL